LAPELITGWKV